MRSEEIILMSKDETVELILWQFKEIEKLQLEISDLKSKLLSPKKNSINSSIPPSKDFKENKESDTKAKIRSHSNGGRELSDNPTDTFDFTVLECIDCKSDNISSKLLSSYDKLFLPEVKIETFRVNVYECVCLSCHKKLEVEIPSHLSNKELLSDSLKAMIMYLHYENHVSYSRIEKYFKDIYNLDISEGLIDSVIKSSAEVLLEKSNEIKEQIRSSNIVCSDETSARVKGKNWWQWVFQNDDYSYHVIEPTRGAVVKNNLFADNHPEIYVSDGYSSQKVGIKKWQICLAHQIRDCNYLIDLDNNEFAIKMKELFQESIKFKNENLETKKIKKDHLLIRLKDIIKIKTSNNSESNLRKRFDNLKEHLFLFLDYDNVPPTNNSSEQALRPSVIFRKVTNGFRSITGKDIFANFRTVIDTAKKQGKNIFLTICQLFPKNKVSRIAI